MIRIFFALLFLYPLNALAQEAKVLSYEELESQYLHSENDTLYIINFWATWCAPCVKELPFFEQAGGELSGKKARVILVSLDFKRQLDSRLNPYIKNKGLQSEVILLDAPGEHIWIPKIDEHWSGAIPATLFIHPKTACRDFYEGSFTLEQLNQTINKNLEKCVN